VSGDNLNLAPGTAENVTYIKTDIGINSDDGFTISGYSGSGSHILYVSTNAGITDLVTLITNQAGYGVISSNGKVVWAEPATGPNGTYTLYIVSGSTLSMKTNTTVTITNGNGTVVYSAFVNVQ